MASASGEELDTRQCGFQPGPRCLDDRTAALLAAGAAVLGRLAADLGLDRVEPGDLSQRLSGERRLGRRVELVEASPAMRPTENQLDRAAAALRQSGEPRVAIDMQLAVEACEMFGGMLALAVLTVDVGGGRMPRCIPGPRVNRVAPQPPGLGPAATGIEYRQGSVISKQHRRGQYGRDRQGVERVSGCTKR